MKLKHLLPLLAWAQALVATTGSLFFSEVMNLPPCVLCWYQRILMYPIVLIIIVGIFLKQEKSLPAYVLTLSLPGLAIAAYHNLLYYGILPESAAPCQMGISCTTQQIEWLGFITIPLLSLVAFTVISVLMMLSLRLNRQQTSM